MTTLLTRITVWVIAGCVCALAVVAAPVARERQSPGAGQVPSTALLSPDSTRAVWTSDDGHSVWSATRSRASAPWSASSRLLTIRGTVHDIAFAPDGSRLAFQNLRAGTTQATRSERWAFIVIYEIATRRIRYVDPSFGIDAKPTWSRDGRTITFARTLGSLPPETLTREVSEPQPWTPPARRPSERFSLASIFAGPFVYTPVASGDGLALAYAAREGLTRTIYFVRIGERARQLVSFPNDDGQELTQVAVSQKGGAVAFVRGANSNPTSLADPPGAEVWIVGSRSNTPQLLGRGTSPEFSPDDRRLAWRSPDGMRSVDLTWRGERLTGVGDPQPVPARPQPAPELRGLASPDGQRIANRRQTGIEIHDVATKTTWTVPDSAGSDSSLVWSPDSRFLAFRVAATGVTGSSGIGGYRYNGAPVASEPWSLWVAEPATSTSRQLFKAKPGMGSVASGELFWSNDHRIAFEWEGDGWKHYYAVPASGGSPTLVTRGDGDVEFVQVSRDRTHLIVTSNIGDLGRRHITLFDFSGATIAIVRQGAASQWAPVQMADGRLAYLEAGHALPPAVMIREADGATSAVGLPQVPASFPASELVEPLLVEYPALDGHTAYGQLFIPRAPNGCGIVFAHGGIRRQMLPGFHYMDAYSYLYELNQYLVSRGCVVLSVEYRSSIMRGYAFRNAPGWGHAGASEMLDVAGGAKYLMARADVDDTRGVGIYGLSWGGYITAQALARYPDLFSVGFDMAGVHTSTDEAGVPHSAMAFLDQWRAPILLSQGDDDRNVVFAEGIKLARALRERRADVDLVTRVVPDETHDMYLTFQNLVTVYQEGADFLLKKLLR